MSNQISRSYAFVGGFMLLMFSTAAQAADISGNWFTQAGEQIINVYKAGPQYAFSLPVTDGMTKAVGNAQPGHWHAALENLSATDTHLHFKIVQTFTTADNHVVGGSITSEYDLNLSPEGARLIGTCVTTMFNFAPQTEQITLFRH